jgi:hypothetical protein
MASSFLGSLIELQLTSGQTARGVLEGVDPITSTLTIRDANTHASSSFSRSDIANLTMLESQPTQAPATQAQGPPPAAEPAVEAPVASTSYPTESEKPEPSALPEPSYDTSSSKKRRERRRKQDAPILEGEEYHHSPSSNHAQAGPGFDQEFDFDAALGKFDKKKIWEEIRVSFSSFFSSYTAKSDLCCSLPRMLTRQIHRNSSSHTTVPRRPCNSCADPTACTSFPSLEMPVHTALRGPRIRSEEGNRNLERTSRC